MVKILPVNVGDVEMQVQSLSQEDPRRTKRQPTPVFWPGKFHEQRNLAGHSLWGHKESDTTEHITLRYITSPIGWREQRGNIYINICCKIDSQWKFAV